MTKERIIEFSIYIENEYWSLLKLISHRYTREKTKTTQNFFASVTISMFRTGYYIWSFLFTFLTWVVIIILYLSFFGSISKDITLVSILAYFVVVIFYIMFNAIYVTFIEVHTTGNSSNLIYEHIKNIYKGKSISLRLRILRDKGESKALSFIKRTYLKLINK